MLFKAHSFNEVCTILKPIAYSSKARGIPMKWRQQTFKLLKLFRFDNSIYNLAIKITSGMFLYCTLNIICSYKKTNNHSFVFIEQSGFLAPLALLYNIRTEVPYIVNSNRAKQYIIYFTTQKITCFISVSGCSKPTV